jgi:trehalose 6-phosphate synthase/phosphatase
VKVRHGRKIVEATASHISKGAAVAQLLAEKAYDVVLVAGDDTTDESMFALASDERPVLTVHVGQGDTAAAYRLADPATFRRFLANTLAR